VTRFFLVGRRRPNPFVVAYRWRYEVGLTAMAATGWVELPPAAAVTATGLLAAGTVTAAAHRGSRRILVQAVQHVLVQHRVRTGCLQAGLANRDGDLPRIMHTRTRGDVVTVTVWLPAGLAPEDVADEAPRLAAACGAQRVQAVIESSRDRVRLVVTRPRWGMLDRW
jgi:hypothetical protein